MNAVAANCIPSQGLHLEHIWIELSPFIHGDITETLISSVITLFGYGKENLLYILSKILSEHKLKLDQMPITVLPCGVRCKTGNGRLLSSLPRNYDGTFWSQVDCLESGPYVAV